MKTVAVLAIALTFLFGAVVAADGPAGDPTVEFHNGSVVRFVGLDEAKKFLGTADDWVRAFGPFDRAMRLQSKEPVSEEDFLTFAAGESRDWDENEIAKMTEVITAVRDRLHAVDLQLELPKEIMIVQTTGAEEGNAGGYTRGKAIIVPEGQLKREAGQLVGFVLHELFHVMTRHNPQIRVPLYNVIGFKPCEAIDYPRELVPRKITNPDAFHFDTYIELTAGSETVLVTPLTLSKSETYTGGGLFSYVTIEFLQLDRKKMAPVYTDGKPTLLTMNEVGGYMEKIGKNTNYIIHAEEIMADNFSLAVRGQREVPNPEILDAVIETLSRKKED